MQSRALAGPSANITVGIVPACRVGGTAFVALTGLLNRTAPASKR